MSVQVAGTDPEPEDARKRREGWAWEMQAVDERSDHVRECRSDLGL
jgi:hypothetical protein